MGAWISTSILMGGWVSTSITMGGWYPGWYTPAEEKTNDNNVTSLHILDCPLCLGNMKLRIVTCKSKQNAMCKTCRPNVGLCPYWQESIRLKMKCKDNDPNKMLQSHKNISTTNLKVSDGPDPSQGKNRNFRIYKCGIAM